MLIVTTVLAACAEAPGVQPEDFAARQGRLVEEARIDGHAELLNSVRAAAVRDDGAIAFLQAQEGQIRFYSSTGTPLGVFGGRGEGPGEFRSPASLGWLADTLWVYDNNRITYIGPDLRLMRTEPLLVSTYAPLPGVAGLIRHPDLRDASLRAIGVDRSFYALVADGNGAAIGRVNRAATIDRRLLPIPAPEADAAEIPGGSAALPFANLPKFEIGPGGELSAVAMATVVGQDAGTFLVTAVGADGDTIYSRRYAFQGDPVTDDVADSIVTASADRMEEAIPGSGAAIRQNVRVPSVHPPLVRLLIGRDGTVWIGQRVRNDTSPWYVIEADGAPLGTLNLPRNSRPITVEREQIWVAATDEVGVPSVVRYKVEWQDSPSNSRPDLAVSEAIVAAGRPLRSAPGAEDPT